MVWLLAFATAFLLSLVLSTVSPLIGTSSVLGPCLGCALDEVQDAGLLDEELDDLMGVGGAQWPIILGFIITAADFMEVIPAAG